MGLEGGSQIEVWGGGKEKGGKGVIEMDSLRTE